MSLDVYVIFKEKRRVPLQKNACGSTMALGITEAEEDHWHSNVTHNMTGMARHVPVAGLTLYDAVWRPEEVNPPIDSTDVLLPLLVEGLQYMVANRKKLLKHNPENGWGSYDSFLKWLVEYKEACEDYPGCKIEVSR